MRRQRFCRLLNAPSKVLVDLGEHLIRPLSNSRFRGAQMARHIAYEVILLALLLAKHLPQHIWLHKVFFRNRELLRNCGAGPLLVLLTWLDGLVGHISVGGGVVGVGAVVAVDSHYAVALIGVESAQWLINWDLLIVDAKAVAMGVWIGEEARLEDWVCRGFDARNHVAWREGDLFDFGEVVLWVLVEGEAAEGTKGDVFLWPHFRQVEDVPAKFLCLLGAEHLEIAGPARIFTVLDAVEEVLGVPIWVLGSHVAGLGICECLAALIGLAVDLDVVEGAVRLGELVRVAGVAVHVAIRVGGATIREEVHDLMSGLLVGG